MGLLRTPHATTVPAPARVRATEAPWYLRQPPARTGTAGTGTAGTGTAGTGTAGTGTAGSGTAGTGTARPGVRTPPPAGRVSGRPSFLARPAAWAGRRRRTARRRAAGCGS